MTNHTAGGFKLVVGLGNPGVEYKDTRHNIGFMVSERILKKLPGSFERIHGHGGTYWKGRSRGGMLFVLNPETYMNLSGKAVKSLMQANDIEVEEVMVVYDDVDLPLGRIRLKKDGGSAGHRGIESLISELGSDRFARLRIGIDSEHRNDQIDFVLGNFAEDEKDLLENVIETSAEALKLALYRGLPQAMNSYNGLLIEVKKEEVE
ncbi:MAG: aminoacyl-tRNA hydrolase [Victivallales bacterium]|nr:aminoacyl-tRNA hydrolase [Victivallales bacterium]